jgi:Bacterial extracellular solute-binding protein
MVLWVTGNQFFAMDDVIHGFQKVNPGVSVALVTLPPSMVVDAIKADGWIFDDVPYTGRPDLYASVSLGHLLSLHKDGLMNDYMTYMHNELVLMVAKGIHFLQSPDGQDAYAKHGFEKATSDEVVAPSDRKTAMRLCLILAFPGAVP